MALVTTVGGETSDSYVSVSEADKYFANHYSTAKTTTWTALSVLRKESVLKRATQQLETLKVLDSEYGSGALPMALIVDPAYEINIHRLEINQRLQFPRNIDIDSGGNGFIPQEVKDAQCEQAVHMLTFDEASLLQAAQGVVEEAVTAGPIKSYTRYAEGIGQATYFSPLVIELMRPFLRTTTRLRRA